MNFNVQDESDDMKPLITFVLGAGASCDADLPLYGELLSLQYFEKLEGVVNNIKKPDEQESWLTNIKGHREKCSSFLKDGADLEALLEYYTLNSSRRARELLEYYDSLIQFVDTLYHTTRTPNYLFAFWNWVAGLTSNGYRVAILTFNHDFLLELICVIAHDLPRLKTPLFSYYLEPEDCILIDELLNREIINTGRPERYKEIFNINSDFSYTPILKLHGSFNWLMCSNCKSLVVAGDTLTFYQTFYSSQKCPKCGGELISSVVPPKRAKDISGLSLIWAKAKTILRNSSTVFFVGYSLPPYDLDALELFSNNISQSTRIIAMSKFLTPGFILRYLTMSGFRRVEFIESGFADYLARRK